MHGSTTWIRGPDGHSQLTVKEVNSTGIIMASCWQPYSQPYSLAVLQNRQKINKEIAQIVLGNIIRAVSGLSKCYVTDINRGQGGHAYTEYNNFQLFLEHSTIHRETLSKGEVLDLVFHRKLSLQSQRTVLWHLEKFAMKNDRALWSAIFFSFSWCSFMVPQSPSRSVLF